MRQSGDEVLSIGKLAKRAEIGVETIRFYEREGLIAEPPRKASGYRQYPPTAVQRLRFIRQAKQLGFSLNEIRELLALRVRPNATCADVRKRARSKIEDIHERIEQLREMQNALERLAARCRGSGPTSECPILEELDGEGFCASN